MPDPAATTGRAMLDRLVTRQAALLAYLADFKLMFFFTLAALPVVPLMRRPDHGAADDGLSAAIE